jgi:hypothetical protein
MRSTALVALTALVIAVPASQSQASIQTYTLESSANYGSDALRVVVNVDNNTTGLLTFNIAITPNALLPNIGDLVGVFLEFNPHPSLVVGDFVGADITDVDFGTINVGGGNNLNGTIAGLVPGGTFDAALTLGSSGSGGGLLTATTFTLDDDGGNILLSHLTGIGIRAQTVGLPPDGGNGSSKGYLVYSSNPDREGEEEEDPEMAPEPGMAAIWVCLSAMGMSWILGRRIDRTAV